ncbi:hypothetical protein AMJ80_12165 [bacterium SM23_31]|nr:MAG: hypothetical protein AMJ80_12165 [bacterium SM23_31]
MKEKEPEEKSYISEEIVITATRTETPYKEIASSITVITKEEIENKQQNLLLDFLRAVPSLDVAQSGGPGKTTSVFIRGAKSEHTLVLIDGVEANDPVSPSRSFDFATFTTDNVERIEILRGPQSTLYGSDAIAGVINIITKKGIGKPAFFFSTEGGTFNTFKNSAGITGGNERFNYALNSVIFDTDGISSAKKDDGNNEKDGHKSTVYSARLGIETSDNSNIDVILRYLDTHTNIDNFGGTGGDDPNNIQNSKQLFLRAEGRYLSTKKMWEQIFGFSLSALKRKNNNDVDADHPADLSYETYKGKLLKFDWQNNIYLNENNIVTIGVETEKEKANSDYYSESSWGPFSSTLGNKSMRTTGIFIQEQIAINKAFFATVGVRVDDHNKYGRVTTHRITPAYLFNKTGLKIKATYGTGFKSPTLYQLYSQYGDENLKPDKSKGWDIGLEQYFFNDKFEIGGTYFQSKFDNMIDFDTGTSTYKNFGEAESKGVEIYSSLQNFYGFSVQAHYTHTITKDKTSGESLLRRPKNKSGLDINYQFGGQKNVYLGIIAAGKRYDLDFSTYPATRITLGSYLLVNLAAAYDITGNFQIFGRVDNLLNAKYEEILGYGTYGLSTYAGLKFRY